MATTAPLPRRLRAAVQLASSFVVAADTSRNGGNRLEALVSTFTIRFGIDLAAFGTSANVERERHVAVAVSLRFMHANP